MREIGIVALQALAMACMAFLLAMACHLIYSDRQAKREFQIRQREAFRKLHPLPKARIRRKGAGR